MAESPRILADKQKSTTTATSGHAVRRVNKQTRTMMILTLTFLLTSVPIGLCSIAMFADDSLAIFRTYLFLLYLMYANSLMNTVVYTSKVPAVRQAVRQLLCLPPDSSGRLSHHTVAPYNVTAIELDRRVSVIFEANESKM